MNFTVMNLRNLPNEKKHLALSCDFISACEGEACKKLWFIWKNRVLDARLSAIAFNLKTIWGWAVPRSGLGASLIL